MAVDIAVMFLRKRVKVQRLLEELCRGVAKASPDSATYAFVNSVRNIQGFCLFSTDEHFATSVLVKEILGSLGEMCYIWKSEHGGCSGSVLYRSDWSMIEKDVGDDDEAEYMLYPCEAFEKAFGVRPGLSYEDKLFFPESFLVRSRCYRLGRDGATLLTRPEKCRVWNHETDAFEVSPLDEPLKE